MKCSTLDLYHNMKKHALENLSIFRSTYICGQLFPNMNCIKDRDRRRQIWLLTIICEDVNLQPSCADALNWDARAKITLNLINCETWQFFFYWNQKNKNNARFAFLLLHKSTKGTTRVPDISHLRAGNYSDSNAKEKTTSVSKYINDHDITAITPVSTRDRFRPCSRDSSGGRTKTAWGINEKTKSSNAATKTELPNWHYAQASRQANVPCQKNITVSHRDPK